MAVSSTRLLGFVDQKDWNGFVQHSEDFFKKGHKNDTESLKKIANITAHAIAKYADIPMDETVLICETFVKTLDSMTETKPDKASVIKVFQSCSHVVRRIAGKDDHEKAVQILTNLVPATTKLTLKFKSLLTESNEDFDFVGSAVLFLADKLSELKTTVKICKVMTDFYSKCHNSGLSRIMVKMYYMFQRKKDDDKSSLDEYYSSLLGCVSGNARIPVLLHNLALASENNVSMRDAFQEIHDIVLNNQIEDVNGLKECLKRAINIVLRKCFEIQQSQKSKDVDFYEELIEMAITVSSYAGYENTFELFRLKFRFHKETTKNYSICLQTAEDMLIKSNSEEKSDISLKFYAASKQKLILENPEVTIPSLNTPDLSIKKREIIAYRDYRELLDVRLETVKTLLKQKPKPRDAALFHIEIASIYYSKNKDLQKGISYCREASKLSSDLDSAIRAYCHFWNAMLKWASVKQGAYEELKTNLQPTTDLLTENEDDGISCGKTTLNMEDYNTIWNHMKQCQILLEEANVEGFDLLSNNDLLLMKNIIAEVFDILQEEPKDPLVNHFDALWTLVDEGHYDHVKDCLQYYENNVVANNVKSYLLMAEVKYLKSHYLINSGVSYDSEGPNEALRNALTKCQSCVKTTENSNPLSLESISDMLRALNLGSKTRRRMSEVMMSTGFSKEMKLYARLNLETGIEICLLPHLCAQILIRVEAELMHDDEKQAQFRLTQIEKLMQHFLRSDQQKIKTKPKQSQKAVLPTDDPSLLCASPVLAKVIYGLPDWILKSERPGFFYEIVVKYFTFQGVVWHYEGDQQAACTYFDLVLKVMDRYLMPSIEASLVCLKWMFECYAQLENYEACHAILGRIREMGELTNQPKWHQYMVDAAISLSIVKEKLIETWDPSPIRSRLYVEARTPTSEVQTKKNPPKLRPKRGIPAKIEDDIEKIGKTIAKLDMNNEAKEEEFKTPLKSSVKKNAVRTASSRKVPLVEVNGEAVSAVNGDEFKTPNTKKFFKTTTPRQPRAPTLGSSTKKVSKTPKTPQVKIYEDDSAQKPVRRSARK